MKKYAAFLLCMVAVMSMQARKFEIDSNVTYKKGAGCESYKVRAYNGSKRYPHTMAISEVLSKILSDQGFNHDVLQVDESDVMDEIRRSGHITFFINSAGLTDNSNAQKKELKISKLFDGTYGLEVKNRDQKSSYFPKWETFKVMQLDDGSYYLEPHLVAVLKVVKLRNGTCYNRLSYDLGNGLKQYGQPAAPADKQFEELEKIYGSRIAEEKRVLDALGIYPFEQ